MTKLERFLGGEELDSVLEATRKCNQCGKEYDPELHGASDQLCPACNDAGWKDSAPPNRGRVKEAAMTPQEQEFLKSASAQDLVDEFENRVGKFMDGLKLAIRSELVSALKKAGRK